MAKRGEKSRQKKAYEAALEAASPAEPVQEASTAGLPVPGENGVSDEAGPAEGDSPAPGATPPGKLLWQTPSRKPAGRALAVTVAAILLVYAVCLPPTVTLEDSGNFLMISAHLGIGHPPGYPLYSLLGKLFTLLPFGSIAFRVHLLSAVLGALACGVAGWIVCGLTREWFWGCVAALALGFSDIFWSQSIIAEVYSLHCLLFLLSLALALELRSRASEPEAARKLLAGFGLVYGLAVSNHWVLTGVATPLLLLVLWGARRSVLRELPRLVVAFALGLLPWVYMVLRSNMDPLISFLGPLKTWRQVLYFILRQNYQVDPTPHVGSQHFVLYTGFYAYELLRQLTPVGLVVAVGGLVALWRRGQRALSVGIPLAVWASSFLLLIFFRNYYGPFGRGLVRVFPMLGYALVSVALGVGLFSLSRWLARRFPKGGLRRTAHVLAGILVVALLALNFQTNNRRSDTWARDFGTAVFDAVEEDALLVVDTDIYLGVLGYLHYVEGVRPDIELYSSAGLLFRNRLFLPVAPGRAPVDIPQQMRELVESTNRPVYFHAAPMRLDYRVLDLGLLKCVDRTLRDGTKAVVVTPEIVAYFESVLDTEPPRDPWGADHHDLVIGMLTRLLTPVYASDPRNPKLGVLLEKARRISVRSRVYYVQEQQNRADPEELLRILQQAEQAVDSETPVRIRAYIDCLRGRLRLRQNNVVGAEAALLRSLSTHPDSRLNPSYTMLEQIYQQTAPEKLDGLRERYGPVSSGG